LWKKKEKEVLETLSPPDSEPKEGMVAMTSQATDVETVQFIEHDIGHTASSPASARLQAISSWAQSNRQRSHFDKEKTNTV
jgi:hypothetical protein